MSPAARLNESDGGFLFVLAGFREPQPPRGRHHYNKLKPVAEALEAKGRKSLLVAFK